MIQTQIICGDCVDVMKRMAGETIDLVVTSPPYGSLRNYQGFNFNFDATAMELGRLLKPGGVIVWITSDETINGCESLVSFEQAIFFVRQCGLNLHDTMIWTKDSLPLNHRRYEQHFEYMFVFSKGSPKTFNPIMEKSLHGGRRKTFAFNSASTSETEKCKVTGRRGKAVIIKDLRLRGNVWEQPVGWGNSSGDSIAFQHPAIFPERLVADHILSWSNEGDTVLDPFAGSGTTLKMARLLQRHGIGIEISSAYCDIIRARIEAVSHDLFVGGVSLFEEHENFFQRRTTQQPS